MRKISFKAVGLTPPEQRMWEDTIAACSWIAPGFVHILYTLLANTGTKMIALFTHDIPAAGATDGWQLIFNPRMFFKYNLMQRVFIVLHEIMHEILNHCRLSYAFRLAGKITLGGKSLDWNDDYANRIQDYIINAILIACKFGEFSTDWLFDLNIADDKDEWVSTYFRHWKNKSKICQQGQPKPGQGQPGQAKPGQDSKNNPAGKGGEEEDSIQPPGQGRFDAHLDPHQSAGMDPHETPPRNEAAWNLAISTAMDLQRAHDKLPAALEQFFNQVLTPVVDWTQHIEGLVHRLTGSGAYDWRRLDRRLVTRGIGAPALTGRTASLVIMPMDSSGSIYQDPTLIDRWLGELSGVIEDVRPERILVPWCDDQIRRIDELEDASDLKTIFYKGAVGGMGTDFRPVFEWIEKEGLEPDVVLYLTDLEGRFPDHAPSYPVIWGTIKDHPVPFGTKVRIPVDGFDD